MTLYCCLRTKKSNSLMVKLDLNIHVQTLKQLLQYNPSLVHACSSQTKKITCANMRFLM